MRFFQRIPTAALAPFIEAFWYFASELPRGQERILPTGRMQLLVNLHEDALRTYRGEGWAERVRIGGTALSGLHTRPFAIDTHEQREIMGVSFRAGGAFPFFVEPAHALGEQHVELAALWGRDGAVLRERLLEAPTPQLKLAVLERAFLERVVRPLAPDPAVGFAIDALERGATVASVTDRLGAVPATFIRRFATRVGLTPKRFARVRRFQRLLAKAAGDPSSDWARLAADFGYYDQAHLIHEFRALSGIRPTAYRPRSDAPYHVPVVE